MELQGVGSRLGLARRAPAALASRLAVCFVLAAVGLCVAAVGPHAARAALSDPNAPVLVSSPHKPPAGYRLTAAAAERIAADNPVARAELWRHRSLVAYEYTKGVGRWQVSWFTRGTNQKELLQVYVDDHSGQVTEAWTGFQVAWTMARGYPGAFGRRLNALYVWIPLCVLFFVPFMPWPRRGGGWRVAPSLLQLDLAVLLAFSVSLAFFNHAKIGLSVPLAYPCLLYLLVRMLLLGFGVGRPRRPLQLLVPASWLAVAVVFLVGFRIGLNVTNSNVIDVGYAGVIGADRLLHEKALYGGWPHDNAQGDTYGPVNYYAYVPFRAAFGWSGTWDDLPAAHAAAVAFDLLALMGLYFLGRLVRGPTTGTVLAYAWAAYPFTLYALSSNSNDSLVGALVVIAVLAAGLRRRGRLRGRWPSALARGMAGALAGLTKFAPLALAPLLARGVGDRRPRVATLGAFVLAYVLTLAAAMLPVLVGGDLHSFWRDTVAYQSGRGSPFSIWGLWGGLNVLQRLVQGASVALAVALAFVPRRRGLVELCALAAAVLIALQLGITHWFYLYIPWFFGLVLAALLGAHPARMGAPLEADEMAAGHGAASAEAGSRAPATA